MAGSDTVQGSELGDAPASADSVLGSSGSSSNSVKDSDIHQIGTFCQVHHISELEGGKAQLLLLGHRRLKRLHTVRPCLYPPVLACLACGPLKEDLHIVTFPFLTMQPAPHPELSGRMA